MRLHSDFTRGQGQEIRALLFSKISLLLVRTTVHMDYDILQYYACNHIIDASLLITSWAKPTTTNMLELNMYRPTYGLFDIDDKLGKYLTLCMIIWYWFVHHRVKYRVNGQHGYVHNLCHDIIIRGVSDQPHVAKRLWRSWHVGVAH